MDEAQRDTNQLPQTIQEIGVLRNGKCRGSAAFVTDYAQGCETTLPAIRDLIAIVASVASQIEPRGTRQDSRVQFVPRATLQNQFRCVQLVRNDGVPVCVEHRPHETVTASRIANE
jgi:hypothetical protein